MSDRVRTLTPHQRALLDLLDVREDETDDLLAKGERQADEVVDGIIARYEDALRKLGDA